MTSTVGQLVGKGYVTAIPVNVYGYIRISMLTHLSWSRYRRLDFSAIHKCTLFDLSCLHRDILHVQRLRPVLEFSGRKRHASVCGLRAAEVDHPTACSQVGWPPIFAPDVESVSFSR